MCDALLELMKDELDERKAQGEMERNMQLISKKIVKGKTIEQIAEELEETVEDILPLYQMVMEKLNNGCSITDF